MTKDDKKIVQNFMDDFWKLFRHYSEPKDDDDFWDEVVENAGELMEKYNHNPVFDQTIAGFVAGIDMKWRKDTGRWIDDSNNRCFAGI